MKALTNSFRCSTIWLSLWVAGLLSLVIYMLSRCLYLAFFHPLANFPGPRFAAVSNIYYAKLWISGRYPFAIEELIKKYGDVVRIAPNELVFSGPNAFHDIHGTAVHNREIFTKTTFQDKGTRVLGFMAERDPDRHRDIARKLQPAFGTPFLKTQEGLILDHINGFIRQLDENAIKNQAIEMNEWINWLAWDLAGDLTYGHDFRHIKDAKTSLFMFSFFEIGVWTTANQLSRRFPLLRPVLSYFIPPSRATVFKISHQKLRERISRRKNLSHPDYMQFLIPGNDKEEMPSEAWIFPQGNELFIGSADPLSNFLLSTVYYLCISPEKMKRLTAEIRGTFKSYKEIMADPLRNLTYLHAVIQESLRIHPNPASMGLARVSPGANVGGYYVPKGAWVQTSHWATTHDERFFHLPREFHPERFLPVTHPFYDNRFAKDNMIAFYPFSLGPRGCAGKNAAYLLSRLIIAKLVCRFDMQLTESIQWEPNLRLYNSIWVKPKIVVELTRV